jgi:glycosyltransferase involved in cell wall biosynthesis
VARHQNVSLHANVTDVRPFLWQCGLMAVPLRIGGGSRLKILEALACACPVVSTRIGSEGLHLCSPREILEVPEVSEMAGKILESLGNPTSAVGMAREGCKRVCEEYSWDPLAEKLGAIWESQFRPAPSRESSPPLSFTSRGITPALPAS